MSTEYSNIPEYKKKHPLIDIDEDISIKPLQRLSFFEKIGLISALVISIIILSLLLFSLYIDFFIKTNYNYAVLDITIGIIMLSSLYFILNAFKGRVVTEILIDTAFQEGVYARMQPLIENIARAHVDTNILLERLHNLDLKVQNISKERYEKEIKTSDLMQEPVAVGTSIKFTVKSIFLITLTMAVFMFLVNFNLGGITQYAVLLIFFLWWGFITNEYKLWKEGAAWTFVFLPVLVVPVTLMILNNLLNYNVLIAALYFSIGVYTFLYYLWANYASTGSLPIIVPEKQEPVTGEFFSLQQKGLLNEILVIAQYHVGFT